jgi:hypothetical protein
MQFRSSIFIYLITIVLVHVYRCSVLFQNEAGVNILRNQGSFIERKILWKSKNLLNFVRFYFNFLFSILKN